MFLSRSLFDNEEYRTFALQLAEKFPASPHPVSCTLPLYLEVTGNRAAWDLGLGILGFGLMGGLGVFMLFLFKTELWPTISSGDAMTFHFYVAVALGLLVIVISAGMILFSLVYLLTIPSSLFLIGGCTIEIGPDNVVARREGRILRQWQIRSIKDVVVKDRNESLIINHYKSGRRRVLYLHKWLFKRNEYAAFLNQLGEEQPCPWYLEKKA
jgi:hypothetical protein